MASCTGKSSRVGNRIALVAHRESLRVVALPAANFAGDVNVRQKIHLDAPQPVALARLAPPALHVEAEAPRPVAAFARFRQHRVQLANRRKHARVRRWIRPRRTPDRRLVDLHDFVDVLAALDGAKFSRLFHRAVQLLRQRAIKDVVDQRGFSRAGNARHHRQRPQRNPHVDIPQIVGLAAQQ